MSIENLKKAFEGPFKALSEFNQFILYKAQWDEKKQKLEKFPIDYRNMRKGSVKDESIYLDSNTAIDIAQVHGLGVGFCFTERDPFFFLDIDNGLDKETNYWKQLPLELLDKLAGAAVEVSVSGKGLHVFGKTSSLTHKNKDIKNQLELYTKERFVALTGNGAMGDSGLDCTAPLIRIAQTHFPKQSSTSETSIWTTTPHVKEYGAERPDEDVIAQACKVKQGSKFESDISFMPDGMFALAEIAESGDVTFKDLFEGNAEKLAIRYPQTEIGKDSIYDQSSADMAIANHLMYFTGGNCEQTKRIMVKSNLKRDKWDRDKYLGEWTITKAFQRWYDSGKKFHSPGKIHKMKKWDETSLMGFGDQLGADWDWWDMPWPDLKTNMKGAEQGPKGTLANFKFLLRYSGITLHLNEMSRELDIEIPGEKFHEENVLNLALTRIVSLSNQISFPKEHVQEFGISVASKSAYHPVKDWVNSKPWDGQDRMQALITSLDAKNRDLAEMLVPKWLVSAISCVYNQKGFASQGVLVLQGEQNVGKTRWISSLAPKQHEFIKLGEILDPSDKDKIKQCVKYWIVELGELDGTFKKSDIAALKAFLTKKVDEFRPAYARGEVKFYRKTIFAASVNSQKFLHDDTGNRRFWTLAIGRDINPDHGIDMQQLFAQVKTLYDSGSISPYLNEHENNLLSQSNQGFEAVVSEMDILESKYDRKSDGEIRRLTASEILAEIGIDASRSSPRRWAPIIAKFLGVPKATRSNGRSEFKMPPLRSNNAAPNAKLALLAPPKA